MKKEEKCVQSPEEMKDKIILTSGHGNMLIINYCTNQRTPMMQQRSPTTSN